MEPKPKHYPKPAIDIDVTAERTVRPDDNVCENGDHRAPPGRRFCSLECQAEDAGFSPDILRRG